MEIIGMVIDLIWTKELHKERHHSKLSFVNEVFEEKYLQTRYFYLKDFFSGETKNFKFNLWKWFLNWKINDRVDVWKMVFEQENHN